MIFSGGGDDCFGRVKPANKNKIVMKPSARAGQRRAVAANYLQLVTCARCNLAAREI
jgi:hypothetical protein